MNTSRQELTETLEAYYRSCGWKASRVGDGTVRAVGPGGVTWIGLAIVPDDLNNAHFEDRLLALSAERMPQGELCPFELLPADECADDVRALLGRLQLIERGHVTIYSLAA